MPVTWCYSVADNRQYCSIGFPMGCFNGDTRTDDDPCGINVSNKS